MDQRLAEDALSLVSLQEDETGTIFARDVVDAVRDDEMILRAVVERSAREHDSRQSRPPVLLIRSGEKRQRRHADDAERSLSLEGIRSHVVATLLVDPRQRAVEEGPVQAIDQNRVGAAAHLATRTCCVCAIRCRRVYKAVITSTSGDRESTRCPVITTDWGAFTETVVEGVTGFRCRSVEEFILATQNVKNLDRKAIRDRAVSLYSVDVIAKQYEKYFNRLMTLWGDGWYTEGNNANTGATDRRGED